MPPLSEYLAYIYFSPNCITGPVLHFREVQDFFYDRLLIRSSTRLWTAGRTSALLWGLLKLTICVTVYFVHAVGFPAVRFMKDHPDLLPRLIYMVPGFPFVMSRLLVVWAVTHVACVVMGIAALDVPSDKPSDEKRVVSWDRTLAVDMARILYARSLKLRIDAWNVRIAFWLRTCIYEPIVEETGSSSFSRFMTLFVSSFWHVCSLRFLFIVQAAFTFPRDSTGYTF